MNELRDGEKTVGDLVQELDIPKQLSLGIWRFSVTGV